MIPVFRIKSLRIDNDLTKKEVAKILNVSAGTYYHYESQRNDIPIARLVLLSNYYKVSLQYLIELSDKKDLFFERLTFNYSRMIANFIKLRKEKN